RRRAGGADTWADLHAAEIESGAGGRPVLLPAAARSGGRFQLLEQRLVEGPRAGPCLYLRGHTSEAAVLVVGGELVRRVETGGFEIEHPLRPEGTYRVALGFLESPTCYQVAHELQVHPATGAMEVVG
ncbi:MAG TPA: hypothetical protein VF705_06405, partial [Longimicrobium sp.]